MRTGVAYNTPDKAVIPTAPVVMNLIKQWAKERRRAAVSLVVIHSHSHGDHTAADGQFRGMPGVELIAATPEAVSTATGISTWPNGLGKIELGNRTVDIIPIPAHDGQHRLTRSGDRQFDDRG